VFRRLKWDFQQIDERVYGARAKEGTDSRSGVRVTEPLGNELKIPTFSLRNHKSTPNTGND